MEKGRRFDAGGVVPPWRSRAPPGDDAADDPYLALGTLRGHPESIDLAAARFKLAEVRFGPRGGLIGLAHLSRHLAVSVVGEALDVALSA
jgi:hypothetical protein